MGNSCGCLDTCGGNNFTWIILLLLLLGGEGCGNICGGDNNFIWIILLLILFGGGSCGMCEAK